MTHFGKVLELLEVATGHLEALRDLAEAGRHHGRALGPDSLLSATEVARELRWGDDQARAWLGEHVPTYMHPGSRARALYRWADVLHALDPKAPQAGAPLDRELPRRTGGAR